MTSLLSNERRGAALAVLLIASTTSAGCFSPLDPNDRPCPCTSGWVCDTALARCVPMGGLDTGVDGGGLDGGRDVGREDAPEMDGGSMDAPSDTPAPIDAPSLDTPDAPFVRCPPLSIVCDDFETIGSDRTPPWSFGDLIERTTATVWRGAGAAHFVAPSDGSNALGMDVVSVAPRDVFVRMWVRIPDVVVDDTVILVSFAEDLAPDYPQHTLALTPDGLELRNGVTGARSFATRPLVADAWTCLVTRLRYTSGEGEVSVEIDGVAGGGILGATAFGTRLDEIVVGIPYSGHSASVGVYLDDVTIVLDETASPDDNVLRCP